MRKSGCLVVLLVLFMAGCGTQGMMYHRTGIRDRDYAVNRIALTEGGLTRQQIQVIASTRPPETFPVDISVITVKNGYITSEIEQQFISSVNAELEKSDKIDRVVPIPEYLLPAQVSFSGIQELGIRTLTEYVLVFVIDVESFYKWTKVVKTKYEITSVIDFFVVDPQTTAIMTSDKMFSKIAYDENLFEIGEKDRAFKEIFSEQGKIVGVKLAALFE